MPNKSDYPSSFVARYRRTLAALAALAPVLSAWSAPARAEDPGVVVAPSSPSAPEEVEVVGERPEQGKTTLKGDEVRQIPGAFGDAFRAVEALPGVTPMVSGIPFFFVRGAPPGNVGYFIDNVRVPLLYHLGLGPSVVHPGLIDHVDFYPGAFPSRFGRVSGGVLSGETRAPAQEMHGEVNLRLIDAGAMLELPFAQGRGSVLVGGRYSYTALLISLAAPQVRLDYWDYQTRVTYALTERDRLTVFAFGSYDFLGEVKKVNGQERTQEIFNTQFHRLDMRWERDLANRARMRVALTLGRDRSGGEETGFVNNSARARFEYSKMLSSDVTLRAGADAVLDSYELSLSDSSRRSEEFYPRRKDSTSGVFADVVLKMGPRVELVPGLRADYYGSVQEKLLPSGTEQQLPLGNGAQVGVDPRVAIRTKLNKSLYLTGQFGVAHQPPSLLVPVPGVQVGRLRDGLQKTISASYGAEVHLPYDFTFTPTFFVQNHLGLTDFVSTCGLGGSGELGDARTGTEREVEEGDCLHQRVRGRTTGIEMLLRRPLTKRLSGWVAYTLSRSTRDTSALRSSFPAGAEALSRGQEVRPDLAHSSTVLAEFDRTHVLNVIGAYDLGAGWRAGARFVYYTGRPYSRTAVGYAIPPFNSERLPDFHRLDLRVEKRFGALRRPSLSLVFEWFNATLRKEAVGIDCQFDQTTFPFDRCTVNEIGPVTIPTVGLEGFF